MAMSGLLATGTGPAVVMSGPAAIGNALAAVTCTTALNGAKAHAAGNCVAAAGSAAVTTEDMIIAAMTTATMTAAITTDIAADSVRANPRLARLSNS